MKNMNNMKNLFKFMNKAFNKADVNNGKVFIHRDTRLYNFDTDKIHMGKDFLKDDYANYVNLPKGRWLIVDYAQNNDASMYVSYIDIK